MYEISHVTSSKLFKASLSSSPVTLTPLDNKKLRRSNMYKFTLLPSKMAQQIKVLEVTVDHLSSSPRTHIVERDKLLPQVVL